MEVEITHRNTESLTMKSAQNLEKDSVWLRGLQSIMLCIMTPKS